MIALGIGRLGDRHRHRLSIDWFPEPASTAAARQIDTLYDVLLIASVPIFVLVMTVAIYCVVRFRAKPGDMRDGAPIHGNTRLEVVWVTIPFLMVTALAIYGWVVLDDIEAKQPNELVVNVTGQQFTWSFEYPAEKVKSQPARAARGPAGRVPDQHQGRPPLLLGARVPAQVRRGAGPHHQDPAHARPDRPATRWSAPSCAASATRRCARTCASCAAAAFDAWLAKQKRRAPAGGGGGGGNAGGGRQGALHRDRAATPATRSRTPAPRGTVGPNLDNAGGRRRQERQGPDPEEYVKAVDRRPEHVRRRRVPRRISCPRTSSDQLSPEEIDALVKYLLDVARR